MQINNQVLIYGAGQRGKLNARRLYAHGTDIVGFCDSYKKGKILLDFDGQIIEKPIFDLLDISEKNYSIIISIADHEQANQVAKELGKIKGVNIVTIEQILFSDGSSRVSINRGRIAAAHIDNMEDYFLEAENKECINVFWGEDSLFKQLFSQLDLENVLELACGRGRHVPQYLSKAHNIILVDILKKNIDYCKERFRAEKKIRYYTNNGSDLQEIESDSCTALFTYDAMVHFEVLDVAKYLFETERILRTGGKALFHHSNNTEAYNVSFFSGKGGRNYMSKQLFAHLADRAGLKILSQHVIDWGEKELDCITLVEKV